MQNGYILEQLAAMETYIAENKGYDEVYASAFTLSKDGTISLKFTAKDNFQKDVIYEYHFHQYAYDSIVADSFEELWGKLYSIPQREARELTVLANQLSGIAGMEKELASVRVQQLLQPILAAREDMKKYLIKE